MTTFKKSLTKGGVQGNVVPSLHDIIYMYWTKTPKDVFYNKTLIEGLLEYVNKDITQGFNRGILNYCLDGERGSP